MVIDGERHELSFGPGHEFECPDDFFTPCRTAWKEPYQAMLDFLASRGCLDRLPIDAEGSLRVSLPFCGSAQELPVLVDFLIHRFMGRPGIGRVSLLASDVEDWDQRGGYWRQKERYATRKCPQMLVRFGQLDLARVQHPSSALTLGIHPECTMSREMWRTILSNIIDSTTGICLIATFKEEEMQVVRTLCQELRQDFEVHRNPYWQARPEPSGCATTYLNYLIVIFKCGR